MAKDVKSGPEAESDSQEAQDGSKTGVALFEVHPYAGLKYRNVFEDEDAARAAATFENNQAQGKSPSVYEFVLIPGVTVVSGGPQNVA